MNIAAASLLLVTFLTLPLTVANADVANDETPDAAESLVEAMEISHKLITRAADNFSCNVPYDVARSETGSERNYLTTLYSNKSTCRDMLQRLNTWGSLYSIQFVVRSEEALSEQRKRTPASNTNEKNSNTYPEFEYNQTLINEIDPPTDLPDSNQ